MPEIARYEPRAGAVRRAATASTVIRAPRRATPRAPFLALEHGEGQADAVEELAARARASARSSAIRDLAGHRARAGRGAAHDAHERATAARALGACVAAGGVAVFPADTVYGLACDPENADAVARLYALKGRPPDKPAAVMFFAGAALAPAELAATRARERCCPAA